jgi:hypothetical protein
VLNEFLLIARSLKVTKSQYHMFLLADMMTWVEVANATCRKASSETGERTISRECMSAVARLFARESLEKVYLNTSKIIEAGKEVPAEFKERLNSLVLGKIYEGAIRDMDLVAEELRS